MFGRNPPTKYQFTAGTNCLIGLHAFVNEQAPGRRPVTEDHVHARRLIDFRSQSTQINLALCLTVKHAAHNIAQYSGEAWDM